MSTTLVIAEKPELARNIARAVCGANSDRPRLPYHGDGITVVACAGHLLELAEPDQIDAERWGKPWREDSLPILPKPWPKVVARGKADLVRSIERELEACSEVIHAGDPDDEGQLIVDELLEYLGYDGPVRRVLINDSIDRNIRRAFERLEDNVAHLGASRSANSRAIADFAFGVNESRLATIRAGRGHLLSVGRVQTPTLGLVVRRDEEIAGHVASTYFVVSGLGEVDGKDALRFTLSPAKSLLDDDGRLSSKEAADDARAEVHTLSGKATTSVEGVVEPPPLPYNLTELTADMSRREKLTAEQVMEATQSLRDDHRAITYNRSDCQYLPVEALVDAPSTLSTALANVGASWDLDFDAHPRCFDDSKVDAHTAIIPQDISVDVAELSDNERKVYVAIVERYAMQFAGACRSVVSRTEISCRCGTLAHKARRQVDVGWRAIRDDGRAEKGFDEGWVDAGTHDVAMTSAKVEEKKTKPRPPYTEGTLVKDMANAAKYVSDPELKAALRRKDEGKPGEHGSIGTTATRASTIETLKKRGYITEHKGRLLSTKLGRDFYHACPPEISGVDTTARWWLIQERVAAGDADEYAVADDVIGVFEAHKDSAWVGASLAFEDGRDGERTVIGVCPRCGLDVVDKGKTSRTFTCSSNRGHKGKDGKFELLSGCGFELWKEQFGHRLTKAQAKALIERGRTGPITFTSKRTGKDYRARLLLSDAGEVSLEFCDERGKR